MLGRTAVFAALLALSTCLTGKKEPSGLLGGVRARWDILRAFWMLLCCYRLLRSVCPLHWYGSIVFEYYLQSTVGYNLAAGFHSCPAGQRWIKFIFCCFILFFDKKQKIYICENTMLNCFPCPLEWQLTVPHTNQAKIDPHICFSCSATRLKEYSVAKSS